MFWKNEGLMVRTRDENKIKTVEIKREKNRFSETGMRLSQTYFKRNELFSQLRETIRLFIGMK